MLCVGKLSLQSNWELSSPRILHHQQALGSRNAETEQQQSQLRSGHSSSLEFAAISPLNVFYNLTLPSPAHRLWYAPALAFRSSKIIDLLVQDTAMAVEPKVYSSCNSSASRGNHLQPIQSTSFGFANSGQSLWGRKELPSVKRGDAIIRAERVSRKPSRESWNNWQTTDSEEYGGMERSSIWDSNAENVRRPRGKRTYYSPEVDEAPSPSSRGRNDRSREDEWDYESEPSRAEANASRGWQWWPFKGGDDDTSEEEDEEDDEEDPSWLSSLNVDLKDTFTLLKWGLPAAFLLGTAVIPSMIANPLTLLFGFSIFPSALKFFSPMAKQFLRAVANPFRSSSSTRKRTRSRPASTSTRRSQDTARYTDFGSTPRPSSRSYYSSDTSNISSQDVRSGTSNFPGEEVRSDTSNFPRQEVRSGARNLGGWDDLVEDRHRTESESLWPLQKRPKSGKKKLARKEQPLYIRLILAFFPFLRGWGGLL